MTDAPLHPPVKLKERSKTTANALPTPKIGDLFQEGKLTHASVAAKAEQETPPSLTISSRDRRAPYESANVEMGTTPPGGNDNVMPLPRRRRSILDEPDGTAAKKGVVRQTLRNNHFLDALDLQAVVTNQSSAEGGDEEKPLDPLHDELLENMDGEKTRRRTAKDTYTIDQLVASFSKQKNALIEEAKAALLDNDTTPGNNPKEVRLCLCVLSKTSTAPTYRIILHIPQQFHFLKDGKRKRRHTFHYIPHIPVTMLHDLRQFYDVNYRTFLVKCQLRFTASEAVQCSPYISRKERMAEEANYLFRLVDEDGSGLIDEEELKLMIEHTGQQVKDEEIESIMKVLDLDKSGEVDEQEFTSWYLDDSDKWLSRRRRDRRDHFNDTQLLTRESMRFHPNIKQVIDDFWVLVDSDGNGEIDFEEYTELSLNLQQAIAEKEEVDGNVGVTTSSKKKKFNQAKAIENARKEWQMDSQGYEFLNYTRFQLCFFQIADAWAKSHTDIESYIQVLTNLLNKTSYICDLGPDKGKRKWRWERETEEKVEVDKVEVPKTVSKVAGKIKQKVKVVREKKENKKKIKRGVKDAVKEKKAEEKKEEDTREVVRKEEVKTPKKLGIGEVPSFTPTKEREALYKDEGGGEKKKFLKRGEEKKFAKKVIMDRSAQYQVSESEGEEEEVSDIVKKNREMGLTDDGKERFEWKPPDDLFSPKGHYANGLSCGDIIGASVHPKIDEGAKFKLQQTYKHLRTLSDGKELGIHERTTSTIFLRNCLEKHGNQRPETIEEREMRLNVFGDDRALWDMIKQLQVHAFQYETMQRRNGGESFEEGSIGYAIEKLLEDFHSFDMKAAQGGANSGRRARSQSPTRTNSPYEDRATNTHKERNGRSLSPSPSNPRGRLKSPKQLKWNPERVRFSRLFEYFAAGDMMRVSNKYHAEDDAASDDNYSLKQHSEDVMKYDRDSGADYYQQRDLENTLKKLSEIVLRPDFWDTEPSHIQYSNIKNNFSPNRKRPNSAYTLRKKVESTREVGIGPIGDCQRVLYPSSIDDTQEKVVYQNQGVITGETKYGPFYHSADDNYGYDDDDNGKHLRPETSIDSLTQKRGRSRERREVHRDDRSSANRSISPDIFIPTSPSNSRTNSRAPSPDAPSQNGSPLGNPLLTPNSPPKVPTAAAHVLHPESSNRKARKRAKKGGIVERRIRGTNKVERVDRNGKIFSPMAM